MGLIVFRLFLFHGQGDFFLKVHQKPQGIRPQAQFPIGVGDGAISMGEHPIKFVRPGGQLYRIFKVTGLVKIDVPAVGHPRDMLLFQFVRTCPCRHGVQVELQNGRADPRRRSGGTLQSLSAHPKKRAILRSTVKYTSHGTAMNERIMPVEAISIS